MCLFLLDSVEAMRIGVVRRFGTRPLAANGPLLLEAELVAGSLERLRFRAEPGRTYHLQAAPVLGGAWVTRWIVPAGAGVFQVELPAELDGPSHFHRLTSLSWPMNQTPD